jgi:hypothetical protein
MTLPEPFVYPSSPQVRRHWPVGYKNFQDYKPWLRDEFAFRCVYCLEREMWYPDRHASFSVEHIVPQRGKNGDPARACDYTNLVYACTRCNSFKQGSLLLDPTAVGMGVHLRVGADGIIQPLTREGGKLVRLLHLNEDPALSERRYSIDLLALKADFPDNSRVHRLFVDAFRYPSDMPDLTRLEPPGGNTLSANIINCYHARAARNELGEVY